MCVTVKFSQIETGLPVVLLRYVGESPLIIFVFDIKVRLQRMQIQLSGHYKQYALGKRSTFESSAKTILYVVRQHGYGESTQRKAYP